MNQRPVLIVVNGAPGVGKTVLANKLSKDLGFGIISADSIKEYLFDTIGIGDRTWSRALGKMTKPFTYELAKTTLQHNKSIIFEAAFWPEYAKPDFKDLLSDVDVVAIELYCHADDAVRSTRYNDRITNGERHIGHVDNRDEKSVDLANYGPIDACNRIDVNTTDSDAADYDLLVSRLTKLMTATTIEQVQESTQGDIT